MKNQKNLIRFVIALVFTMPMVVQTAVANVYTVNDIMDEPDVTPGDTICATVSGSCTLRAAFMEAEASELYAVDEIILPAGHYRLTRPHTLQFTPSSIDGDLVIGIGPVTLRGAGPDVTIIEQTVEDRVLRVYRGEAVIEGVTLRGGRALSDEIEAEVRFALPRNLGGGILASNSSGLTLRSVVVTDNEAAGTGGGVFAHRWVPVVLENVQITDNRAGDGVGGLGVFEGPLNMVLSTVSGNQGLDCGGISVSVSRAFEVYALYRPIRIRRSRVTGNEAFGESHRRISGGSFPTLAGGICVISAVQEFRTFGGDFALEDTLVQGNVGGSGGGFSHRGVAGMDILRSTFFANNATDGGGLFIDGSGQIRNSTISNNASVFDGGGIFQERLRAGYIDRDEVYHRTPSSLVIQFSTIAFNGPGQLSTSDVRNSLQLLGTVLKSVGGRNCNIPMDSIGSNVDSGTTCLTAPGPGDLSGVDPELLPIADNGGATPTHALSLTSPAIDAYVLSRGCPGTDQRLALRPAGAVCDAGAYELDAVPLNLPAEPPLAPGDVGGGSIRLVLSDGVFRTLSLKGVAIEALEPADGKSVIWTLPSVGGYLGAKRQLLVQRGGLDFTRGKRSFETLDWVVRLGPDGGQVVSYARQAPPRFNQNPNIAPPFFGKPSDLRERPLVLFDLEPTGQTPNLLIARLTERAAKYLNLELNVRDFKPGMEFGTLLLEPELVDPKEDPPGDPLPLPNG